MRPDGPLHQRPGRPHPWYLLAVALASASATACTNPLAAPGGPSSHAGAAIVEHVIDGDTVDVRIDGTTERLRLIGVDTPETVDPDRPAQCFGAEASARTKELLPPGTAVRIERDDVARDRYGRLLVYVWRTEDELLVNLDLIAGGFADAVTFGDNEALYTQFAAAEATARANGVGLWGACGGADVALDGAPG